MDLSFGRSKRGNSASAHRLRAIESFNHDGVLIARRRKHRRSLPMREILLFLVAVVAFKVVLVFDMGAAGYGAKVAELSGGTTIEQWAGWAMRLDPVSQYIVDQVRFAGW